MIFVSFNKAYVLVTKAQIICINETKYTSNMICLNSRKHIFKMMHNYDRGYCEKTVTLYLHFGILRMSDSAMVQGSNKR